MQHLIEPDNILNIPYRDVLIAIARGDGRMSNVFRRAHIGESVGMDIVDTLVDLGILRVEKSRQAPLRKHHKHLLKKSLRGYKIESKIRFVKPFYRFWFGFVEPYKNDLLRGKKEKFMNNFHNHKDRATSLVFEQLSNTLLETHLKEHIVSSGSFWDHKSEFDILSVTASGGIILGECKYTSRSITKKELTKLKEKALHSGIKVDTFALFSKSGFSNELIGMKDESLLLFDLDDYVEIR